MNRGYFIEIVFRNILNSNVFIEFSLGSPVEFRRPKR